VNLKGAHILQAQPIWRPAKMPAELRNRVKVARRIYIDIVADWQGGPAIIVADNGTGFQDAPDEVVQPFFSRRPDGMGLGLYYANMVMQLNDGRLEIPDRGDAELPEGFTGAVVALVFKGID